MTQARWLILAWGVFLALTARAGAQATAEAIVDKAIEARGGANALERASVLAVVLFCATVFLRAASSVAGISSAVAADISNCACRSRLA